MIALFAMLAAAAAPSGPVDFTAQTMRMEPRERRTHLDGSVRLSRDGMVVTGDRAVVDFAAEEQAPVRKKPRRRNTPKKRAAIWRRLSIPPATPSSAKRWTAS